MGQAIPRQHPAVVLRSHYQQLRALLAIAMIAVVGLTAAVVILATDDAPDTSAGSATQASTPSPAGSTRYDGGPEEGTAASRPHAATTAASRRAPRSPVDPATRLNRKSPPGVRYDGGPEEGTRGALSSDAPSNAVPGTRYDGGPEEGSRGSGR